MEAEDALTPQFARTEHAPSQEEIDSHEISHWPYRSWCPSCIQGAAISDPHRRGNHTSELPIISIGYSSLSSEDQESEGAMPVLNIKDSWSKKVAAEIVPRKGNNEYALEVLTDFIKQTGYKRIILKSDQEPAILSLKDFAASALPHVNVTMETSPIGESSSNSIIESQIRRTTALVRVHETCLESHLQKPLETSADIIPWMVRHCAKVFNYYRRNNDGRTPWEIERGRKFNKQMAIVGESVWFLLPSSLGKWKLDVRWSTGIWLGVHDESGELLIGTPRGATKARTFKRKSTPSDRWNYEELLNIKGTPWQPYPGDSLTYRALKPQETFEGTDKIADTPAPASKVGRIIRFQIRKLDIKVHAATKACGGCAAAIRGAPGKHTSACYDRFRELFEQLDDPRVAKYDERIKQQPAASSGENPADNDETDTSPPLLEFARRFPHDAHCMHIELTPGKPMPDETLLHLEQSRPPMLIMHDMSTPCQQDTQYAERVSLLTQYQLIAQRQALFLTCNKNSSSELATIQNSINEKYIFTSETSDCIGFSTSQSLSQALASKPWSLTRSHGMTVAKDSDWIVKHKVNCS